MDYASLYEKHPFDGSLYESRSRVRPPGAAYPACASLQRSLPNLLASIHGINLTRV